MDCISDSYDCFTYFCMIIIATLHIAVLYFSVIWLRNQLRNMMIIIIPSLRLVFWLHNLLCFVFIDIYHGLVVPLRCGAPPHQHSCCCHRDHDHHLQDDGALEGVHHTWH